MLYTLYLFLKILTLLLLQETFEQKLQSEAEKHREDLVKALAEQQTRYQVSCVIDIVSSTQFCPFLFYITVIIIFILPVETLCHNMSYFQF